MQGSGKTLAFGLPILQRIMLQKEEAADDEPTRLRALILAPTRELALQVCFCWSELHIADVARLHSVSAQVRILGSVDTMRYKIW